MVALGAPPESLWQRAAVASHAVLMLDYDGTLAPFHDDPGQATPYPGVERLLQDIATVRRDRLILISGRALDDLEGLMLLPPTVECWGSHGRERRFADGRREMIPIPETAATALDVAESWRSLIESAGGIFERKPMSIAFHWRALDTDARRRVRRQLASRLAGIDRLGDLFWHAFDGGLELRVQGVDKGTAVRQVLTETRGDRTDPALLAYLGDDTTDEDAFRALGNQGFSILVRDRWRPTHAQSWLSPPGELLRFLERWLELRRQQGVGAAH